MPTTITPNQILELFKNWGMITPRTQDEQYTQMPESEIMEFVKKYYNRQSEPMYTSNPVGTGVFDCDDFAMSAKSAVAKGGLREGLKSPLLFGRADYFDKKLGNHQANISVTPEGKIVMYDPTYDRWLSTSSPNVGPISFAEF